MQKKLILSFEDHLTSNTLNVKINEFVILNRKCNDILREN